MAEAVVCDTCRAVGVSGAPETHRWLMVQRLHGDPQSHHFCSPACASEWFSAHSARAPVGATRPVPADPVQEPPLQRSVPRLAKVVAASTRPAVDVRRLDDRRGRRRSRG